MKMITRQYTPDGPTLSGGNMGDNPGAAGGDVSGSRGMGDADSDSGTADEYDEGGTTGDAAEGESGVPGRGDAAGTISGKDNE